MTRSIRPSPNYSDWTRSRLIERLREFERRNDEPDRAGRSPSSEMEALEQSENLPGRITDALPILISYIDSEQRYIYCNKAYEAWFGHARESICGRRVKDIHGGAAYAAIQGYIETALSGEMVNFQDTIPYGSGGSRHIHAVYVPDIGDTGETKGIFVAVTDNTEQKRTEEKLRHSEERFKYAIENSNESFALYDADENLMIFNTKFSENSSLGAPFLSIGMSFEDVVTAIAEQGFVTGVDEHNKREWIDERLITFRERKELPGYQMSNGRWRQARYDGLPDGSTIARYLDITDQKRQRDALRESEERFRAFFDNSPLAMMLKDKDSRFRMVNRRFEDWYGVIQDETFGKTSHEVFPHQFVDPYVEQDRETIDRSALTEREYEFRFADGTDHSIFVTKFPVLIGGDQATGIGTIVTDVTEYRKIENSLRQAQKMEAVGQLTGGIAHEFNNLLMVIFGNLEMLDGRLAEDDPLRQFTSAASRGAMRGAELTQSLLAFSRKQELNTKLVDLNDLVLGMSDMLRRSLGETIIIENELAESLWRTSADGSRIEGALLNLCINSRDAMANGGTIRLRTSNAAMGADRVAAHPDVLPGDYVMLEVADTGTGMTAEQIEHAFEPFYTTKEVGEGTGLGLSVVYGFAKQSGGFVEIDSEVGRGTTVRLCLPRAEQTDGALDDETSEPAAPVDGGGTVLVVEDDADVRALVVGLMSDLGYDIVEAEDGHAALASLDEREDIDLLFTDMVLPGGMNGRDIAREGRLRHPGLKVVFTSGYPDTEYGDPSLDDDGPEFIRKPYRKSELAKKLAAILEI